MSSGFTCPVVPGFISLPMSFSNAMTKPRVQRAAAYVVTDVPRPSDARVANPSKVKPLPWLERPVSEVQVVRYGREPH